MALLYGPEHPYGRRAKGTISSVEALTRERLAALHSTNFAPSLTSVVVVGDSIIRGRYIDNGALVSDVARAAGFAEVARSQRAIRRTRRSFNLSVARAKHEHVLLFAKQ